MSHLFISKGKIMEKHHPVQSTSSNAPDIKKMLNKYLLNEWKMNKQTNVCSQAICLIP